MLTFRNGHLSGSVTDAFPKASPVSSHGQWFQGWGLWLRLARVSGDALAARAASAGLAVLPGSALFADSAPGNYVRVPFTAPPATLSKAAALLKAAHANLA